MLPLWQEHNCQGSDPPKMGPETNSERQHREKTTKIDSGAVSGRTFSPLGQFSVDFGVPAGSQNLEKGTRDIGKNHSWDPSGATFPPRQPFLRFRLRFSDDLARIFKGLDPLLAQIWWSVSHWLGKFWFQLGDRSVSG